ncbi:MAG: hypothetical protein AABY22_02640 [Nanoarchaeota archaeon]
MAKNSLETLRKRNEKRNSFRYLKNQVKKYLIKICKDCKKKKLCRFNSSFTVYGVPEYKTRCDDCQRSWYKDYNAKHRKDISLWARLRKQKRKIKYIQYLGGKCCKCGYKKSNRALTFHHKNRLLKGFSISQAIDNNWEKVKKELDKCILICFNCHMEEEEKFEQQKHGNI